MLQQLQSSEAVLVMYLADELPPEDRAEVARRLEADPRLRADLDRLRGAHDAVTAAMSALDRSTRLPAPEAAAVRRVAGAMREWHARRVARPVAPPPAAPARYPRWAYPVAAAASVVIGLVAWWGLSDRGSGDRFAGRNLPLQFDGGERPSTPDFMAAMILATSGPIDPPEEVALLVAPTDYAVLAPHAVLMPEPAEGGGADGAEQPGEADPAQPEREQDDWQLFL